MDKLASAIKSLSIAVRNRDLFDDQLVDVFNAYCIEIDSGDNADYQIYELCELADIAPNATRLPPVSAHHLYFMYEPSHTDCIQSFGLVYKQVAKVERVLFHGRKFSEALVDTAQYIEHYGVDSDPCLVAFIERLKSLDDIAKMLRLD